jgi:putative DNA primase/helicase
VPNISVQAIHARVAAVQLNALDGFKLASMIGASLIYCDEAPQRGINEQMMKSLIAGESVQIDRKYRDPITAKITGKWLILANHMPAVTDQSAGFWRRFDIIPFDVIIPEREREAGLAEKIIAAELPGILNWALAGLLRLRKRGHFDPVLPAEIMEAQATARRETNSVEAWFADQAIGCITDMITLKSDVYSHYSDWCKSNGMAAVGSPRFWNRLGDKPGYQAGRKRVPGRQISVCNLRLPEDTWEAPELPDNGCAQTVQGEMSYPVH